MVKEHLAFTFLCVPSGLLPEDILDTRSLEVEALA